MSYGRREGSRVGVSLRSCGGACDRSPAPDIPSVVERTRPVAAGAPVVAVHFLGNTAAFVLGEETLLLVAKDGARAARARSMRGAILASASDGERIITGGDDGKVVATDAQGRQRRSSPPTPSTAGSITSRSGRTARSPGRPASRPSRAPARAREQALDAALDRRRAGVRAEGLSARHRPLQRRHALVPERARGRAREARMEGLASRRER